MNYLNLTRELPERQPIKHRPLYRIACDIQKDWKHPYFGARPYLQAMSVLTHISDHYMNDTAASIVNYFLVNSSQWRGEVARTIKVELRNIIKAFQENRK